MKFCFAPFYSPFCRIFLHMVGLTPGKCSNSGSCLQSVMGTELLSKGSEHFGSESDRQTQHLIAKPENDQLKK